MIILGIETSCDETACGIVRDGREVLGSVIASQIESHRRFGGVVPEVAAREHLQHIDPVVSEALREARMNVTDIDAVAVTQGPGLIGALLVGASYAKGLAAALNRPLIPVDHVRAHVHGALLSYAGRYEDLLPCLSLVVSGGHTNLYYMRHMTDFELLASSSDDACGECFDKVAKTLGLPYPGGPQIEALAKNGVRGRFPMPQMMEEKSRLTFSYSGLKTHMVNAVHRMGGERDAQKTADLCAAFQDEALGQITRKLSAALRGRSDVKSILVAGGVSANQRFRELCQERFSLPFYFPPLSFCSDNGAMIAASAFHIYKASDDTSGFAWQNNWDAYSRQHFA